MWIRFCSFYFLEITLLITRREFLQIFQFRPLNHVSNTRARGPGGQMRFTKSLCMARRSLKAFIWFDQR